MEEIRIKGIAGSPGITIGQAYLIDNGSVDVIEKYNITKEKIIEETNKFRLAIKKANSEIQHMAESMPQNLPENIRIIETYTAITKDKAFYDQTIKTIEEEKINVAWALRKTVLKLKNIYNKIKDKDLKSKFSDIMHVSSLVLASIKGTNNVDIARIDKRVILVAKDISPTEIVKIQLEKIKGFITDFGNKTSHTTIVAKNLQIPCVIGLKNATKNIKNEDIIIVDALKGLVIIEPNDETIIKYEELLLDYQEKQAMIARKSTLPAKTKDGKTINVYGNIELSEEVVSVLDNGGEGIGLYRTEFSYLQKNSFPNEEELFNEYVETLDIVGNRPVTFRTLDINGDKALKSAEPSYKENNPALGFRGIRFCLNHSDVFKTQLRAIIRASHFGNIKLLIPFVSSVEEVEETLKIVTDIKKEFNKKKIPYDKNIEIGIMIEVPSAVMMAEELSELVDFFSIGTNDLVQYTLAADRSNQEVAYLYDSLHPAILKMINTLAGICEKKKIELQICGEMASEPLSLPILIGLGIKEISVNTSFIPAVKDKIRNLNFKECQNALKKILKKRTTEDIYNFLNEKNFG